MQEALGGADAYKKAYLEKLDEVFASGENMDLSVKPYPMTKKGDGSAPAAAKGF